jgi:hypothetical protein
MERLSRADHDENDLIAPALEPNRVHEGPQIVWGVADSDAQSTSNNGRVRTWTRNKVEMKRMGAFYLLTIIGAGESSRAGSGSVNAAFDTGRI